MKARPTNRDGWPLGNYWERAGHMAVADLSCGQTIRRDSELTVHNQRNVVG